MGNCLLNIMRFDPALPSSSVRRYSSPPNCIAAHNMKRLSAAAAAAALIPPSKRRSLTDTPILPFCCKFSNLATLYDLGPELGRGQFGIIRSCTSRSSGARFACKSISKVRLRTIHDIKDIVREVCIMKRLSNHTPPVHGCPPGSIVRLHEVMEDKSYVHLIMELCNGGELFDRIVKMKCYPEAQAAFLMKSLLETLQFCHSMGVMHRDLKPENILLVHDSDTSPIKLADFGLALDFTPGQKFCGMAGSAYYIAPEVLQGEYSQEIDMWSAGVIMYVLLSGVPPFWGPTEQGIFKAIQVGELDFASEPWHSISSAAKDLIARMLCLDVKSRWNPAQALKHPWIIHHTEQMSPNHIGDTMRSEDAQLMSGIPAFLASTSSHHMDATEHGNGHELGARETTMLVNLGDSTTVESSGVKPELNELLLALIAGLDKGTLSLSESLASIEVPGGWTCTFLTLSATEETLMVDMGQEKYLIVNDRRRKRIGWKLLKQQLFRRRRDEKIVSPRALQTLQPVF